MNYDLIELPAFNVQGIAARVRNEGPQAIAELWQRWFGGAGIERCS
jgi:predicted transcriptional regulator YdeE